VIDTDTDTGAREPSLAEAGKQAKAAAQRLLDRAQEGLRAAEDALSEAAATPLFGNGLAGSMRDAMATTAKLATQVTALKTAVENYDRREVPDASKDRAKAMRGEP